MLREAFIPSPAPLSLSCKDDSPTEECPSYNTFKWDGRTTGNGLRESDDIVRAIETHSDTVLRVCTLYFRMRPEREDAYQETFLKYSQSSKEFADEEHRKAWLISVATNTCKDMLKRAEAKTVLTDVIDETARQSWQPQDDSSAGGRAEELNEALQQLDEKYRLPLYLKYYEGYSAAEISDMLGMPENTVYTNLSRGREKLKEVLTRER